MKIPTPVITLIVGLALAASLLVFQHDRGVRQQGRGPRERRRQHRGRCHDLSTLTAQDDGTTLTATPVDGETGSGF
jgi:hypothetical protein